MPIDNHNIVYIIVRQLVVLISFILFSYMALMCTTGSMRRFNQRIIGLFKRNG